MTDLEQKIILNSYDVFPIKYIEGTDVNSAERTAYIKGGIDAIKMYEGDFDELLNIPPVEISNSIIEMQTETIDSSEGIKEERSSKLF